MNNPYDPNGPFVNQPPPYNQGGLTPPPPGAMPPAPGGYYGGPTQHPKGTTILILGIVGVLCCTIGAIIALIMGNNARKEIAAGLYAPTTSVTIGWVLGLIGTILGVGAIVLWILMMILGIATGGA